MTWPVLWPLIECKESEWVCWLNRVPIPLFIEHFSTLTDDGKQWQPLIHCENVISLFLLFINLQNCYCNGSRRTTATKLLPLKPNWLHPEHCIMKMYSIMQRQFSSIDVDFSHTLVYDSPCHVNVKLVSLSFSTSMFDCTAAIFHVNNWA